VKKNGRKQIRLASSVIIFTISTWMFVSYIGGELVWEAKFAFLFDFCAIAAFLWALVVIFRVWLNRPVVEEN
jgi:hypothetical protein